MLLNLGCLFLNKSLKTLIKLNRDWRGFNKEKRTLKIYILY